jgi:hypothetical protein
MDGVPVLFADLLTVPARRDIKGMGALLTELRPGEELAVTFKSRRYGVYNIAGPAMLSQTAKAFMIGSRFIETNRKPEREVQAIRDTAEALALITAGDQLCADEDAEALLLAVKEAVHGSIVRATFE